MARGERGLPAWWIAAAAGLVPLAAVHVGLVVSIAHGEVDPGVPHVDGTASISRACRREPAVHLFRALVLPTATLAAATWWIAAAWLRERGLAGGRARGWVLGLGLAASVALVLYATFLGTEGPFYRLMRRYGIYVFFGGTGFAELALTIALARARPRSLEPRVLRAMVGIVVFLAVAGPVNVVADRIVDHDVVGNALEWWFAIGLTAYLVLLGRVWAVDGVRLRVSS